MLQDWLGMNVRRAGQIGTSGREDEKHYKKVKLIMAPQIGMNGWRPSVLWVRRSQMIARFWNLVDPGGSRNCDPSISKEIKRLPPYHLYDHGRVAIGHCPFLTSESTTSYHAIHRRNQIQLEDMIMKTLQKKRLLQKTSNYNSCARIYPCLSLYFWKV